MHGVTAKDKGEVAPSKGGGGNHREAPPMKARLLRSSHVRRRRANDANDIRRVQRHRDQRAYRCRRLQRPRVVAPERMPHNTTPQPTTKGDRNGGVLREAPPFNFLLHYVQERDGIERRLTCKGVLINWQLRYATCSPRNRLSFVLLVSLHVYYNYLR